MSKNINVSVSKSINSNVSLSPDIQKILQDSDSNGIPDMVDNALSSANHDTQTKITINGQDYSSWDEVPDEFKSFQNLAQNIKKNLKTKSISQSQPSPQPVNSSPAYFIHRDQTSSSLFSTKTILIVIALIAVIFSIFQLLL